MLTDNIHYETVLPILQNALHQLMSEEIFTPFRLVGGTNLSLRYGHRKSIDIDLFTDAEYGSLDFKSLEHWLQSSFPYYNCYDNAPIVGFGRTYYIGRSINEHIKLDLMYADPFLDQPEIIDGIRFASVRDIIAMKMNVVLRGGRKKDFWDLHFLLGMYPLDDMLDFHAARYDWEHDKTELLKQWTNFSIADQDPDPMCLLNKNWDDIKLDIIDTLYSVTE